jgi:hypothetical protein
MATIEDLNKSITEMSDPELLDLLRQIRLNRRAVKPKAEPKPKQTGSKQIIKQMTRDSAAELLAMLEGELDGPDSDS